MSSNTDTTVATTAASNSDLPQAPESLQTGWTSLVPMVLIFVVFYFFLIRPQEKKRKAQEALIGSVKKGEDVVTHSGIYGTITKLNDSDGTAELTIAKDVTIKILKSAVADIISRKQQTEEVKQVVEKQTRKKK